ncbi:MAG: PLP-dependent aminotransferase family protein [Sedimenticola sp.]|nr:PLP-dependent aminotransferase family protein [Sedimenticola sp.]
MTPGENVMFAERIKNLNSSFIRDILAVTQQPDIISFAGGLPDPALFPAGQLQEAGERMRQRLGNALYQYGETAGVATLREQIAANLSDANTGPENLLVTTGSQQGLDLVVRCLVDPGERVVVEGPTYLGALQVLRANQAQLLSIASDADGPDLDALETLLKEQPIRCFYAVPDFHNPTGACYSLRRRQRLLALAEMYDFWILEDSPYSALRYRGESLPSLHSLAPQRVIQFGSFSKIIAPALRLGWINSARPVIKVVEKLKQAADLHSSGYDQQLVLQFLLDGCLQPHLERLREIYGERLDAMASALERELGGALSFHKPQGGMFIWATLKRQESTLELFRSAIAEGVAFVPGEAFYVNGEQENSMRLNFSNSSIGMIEAGVTRLAGLINVRLHQTCTAG